jgi:tetratricopeptide (TPR) repeat protein
MVWQQTAAIAESALGRGLASQGLISDAKHALVGSLERAPSIDAYETLTTIDVQTDRFASAQEWAQSGLSMLGDKSSGDRYRRAKLERIEGDVLRGLGKHKEAATRYLDALRSWASLGESKDLPRTVAAERLLDSGRAMYGMGDPDPAVDLVMRAVDIDADTADIAAGAVAFLIEAGRYRDAVDAFHRGLGANLSDFYKVYMCLWIAGEAKRVGEPLDRLAADYLASRQGDTWYELLARAATGHLPYATLVAAATTGPRQAELAFFTATLDLDPTATTPAAKKKLYAQVLAAKVVLDAEYDLARRYLALLP